MNNVTNKISIKNRNPIKFDVIDLYNIIGREKKLKLNNTDDKNKFLQLISNSLDNNFSDTLLYGKHIETMFSYIAAFLGKCKFIKKEDNGDIFSSTDVLIPDYRIVLNDNSQILIEVKNFYQKSSTNNYKISKKNFDKLLAYSNLMKTNLMFAIYWAKWKTWTLVDPKIFSIENNNMTLSFKEAIINNEMGLLGDYMIATQPPLSVRIYADSKQNNTIINENGGETEFVIKQLKFYSNNNLISDKIEKNIIFNLILFGSWHETNEIIFEKNSNIVKYIEFKYYPEEYSNNQPYAIVSSISDIITKQYFFKTFDNGKIESLAPNDPSVTLGLNIPNQYKKKTLPLWFFYIKTKSK